MSQHIMQMLSYLQLLRSKYIDWFKYFDGQLKMQTYKKHLIYSWTKQPFYGILLANKLGIKHDRLCLENARFSRAPETIPDTGHKEMNYELRFSETPHDDQTIFHLL